MKRAGLLLILCALLGIGFFLATEPRIWPKPIVWLGWGPNLVDTVHDAFAGTVIGLAGSLVILLIGLWLLVRRSV